MPNVDASLLLTHCKATADSLRLDILRVLTTESLGVLELCHIFETPQPGMSHHLKVLLNAGLVATRREGTSIFYRRALIGSNNPLAPLVAALYNTIDAIPLNAAVANRAREVQAERAERAKQFFARHGEQLRQNQNQIAEFQHYANSIIDMLGNEPLPATTRVLELGPGDSPLINELASRYASITAVDNSTTMLARARETVLPAHKGKLTFIHADLYELAEPTPTADLLVLNMVLHHLPSPAGLFQRARELLVPGGSLLIVDLCPHDQDWARQTCGDLWLGFEPVDLDTWAADAGLTKGQSSYLGLKNGFQIQIRLFHTPKTGISSIAHASNNSS